MSHHFKVENFNYEWANLNEQSIEKEYYNFLFNSLRFKYQIFNLFKTIKEAYLFANDLFKGIDYENSDSYEEVEFKVHNCKYYFEKEFKDKTEQFLQGIYYSESKYERYSEIFNSYIELTKDLYDEIFENKLEQIGRIATWLNGIVDHLQFTLEINDLYDTKKCEEPKSIPEEINYKYDTIGRAEPEKTLLEKRFICA